MSISQFTSMNSRHENLAKKILKKILGTRLKNIYICSGLISVVCTRQAYGEVQQKYGYENFVRTIKILRDVIQVEILLLGQAKFVKIFRPYNLRFFKMLKRFLRVFLIDCFKQWSVFRKTSEKGQEQFFFYEN